MRIIKLQLGKCTQKLAVQKVLFEHELDSVLISTLKQQMIDLFNKQDVIITIDNDIAINKLTFLGIEVQCLETE